MFIVYKTTNTINGHYYIGVHKQFTDSFDGYLGSGTGLKRAIEKYGIENFQRQTLFSFDNVEDAYDKETELLNQSYKLNECYNMRPGGRGIRGKIHFHSDEWKKKVSDAHKGKKLSEKTIEKIKKYDRSYMKTDEYRSAMLKLNSSLLKPFGLIIGSFSLGLISGFFYPILIPVSAVYAINTIIDIIETI